MRDICCVGCGSRSRTPPRTDPSALTCSPSQPQRAITCWNLPVWAAFGHAFQFWSISRKLVGNSGFLHSVEASRSGHVWSHFRGQRLIKALMPESVWFDHNAKTNKQRKKNPAHSRVFVCVGFIISTGSGERHLQLDATDGDFKCLLHQITDLLVIYIENESHICTTHFNQRV